MEDEYHLDQIDRQILKFLEKDAKISLKIIADELGKSETTIRRRIKALEDNDIISGYTIRYKFPSKKSKIKTFLRIVPDLSKTHNIVKKLFGFSEIIHIYHMSGQCGIWVLARLDDIPQLSEFLDNKLGKIEGIKSIENCIILNEYKKEFEQ
ncbi:MAG: Lrp/AsnC family transcriptional regulator [Candidatus Helarchaeota archaeon]|nr:Lrp/AsnC family transcriptional regulator [Candidatus Helarchaeota archaeon]